MTSRSWGRSGRSWSNALRHMKADRLDRPAIREERLRGTVVGSTGLGLSGWRGLSGRRYVVAVYAIPLAEDADAPGAVILGVRRDDKGVARIVGAGHRGTLAEAVVLAAADGANEIHLHNLADSDAEREAIVADLVGDDAI